MLKILEDLKLTNFLRNLEGELSDVKKFKPRYIEISTFMPSNDEEMDKYEELQADETIILERVADRYNELVQGDYDKCMILAVDTSSFKIGETEKGIVAAYRASIAVFDGEKYDIARLGPFIVNVTEENKGYIYNYLRNLLDLPEVNERKVPKIYKMVDRVRNFIERYLQVATAGYFRNGMILWDGSLTGDTVDTPRKVLEDALEKAYNAENAVFGVSKTSRLRTLDGRRLIDLLSDVYKPAFIKVHELIKEELAKRILGEVYAVKFEPHGFTFRVDVYPRCGFNSAEELNRLYSLCPMFNGYPDPLRQSHINCYFTGNEVLALQAYVVQKYGLEVLPSFDPRKFILYPF